MTPLLTSIIQDLRFAARRLVKDRRFTLAAIAALALGIGATSAVFTLVNAVLLRSLPFDDPDRVMWLGTRDEQNRNFGVSLHDFEDWRRAERQQVWWLVLRRGIVQLAIGLVLGLAGALGVGRLLQSLLVGTGPADAVTLVSVSLVLVTVGVAACVWPARRATRLDPVKALRYE